MLNTRSPVLVTGGAGFIGAAIVRLLRSHDIPVTVIDRLHVSNANRLAAFEEDDGFVYHAIALNEAARLESIVEGHTTIFHLAANTENRADRAGADADVTHTVMGTVALLQALATTPEAMIVLASSQLVYAVEGEDEPITEANGKLAPPTPFAAGKAAAEAFLHAHCREHGHHGAICRLANIVGPEMRRGIVRDLTTAVRADSTHLQVLGDGRQTRSYLHVEDCAAAMIKVAATHKKDYAIYNVCNEDAISAATVAEIVAEETVGERPTISYTGGSSGWRGDVPMLRVLPEALLDTGWRPTMSSREAVQVTARAMLAAPSYSVPAGADQPPSLPPAQRWEVLGQHSLYESKWVGLSLVSVKPPGREPYDHHVVTLPAAVGVVVNCSQKGVLLLHRHRFITDSTGFEIPAGGIDDCESIMAAAEREVLEETGWRLADVEHLISCNVSDGVSDQRFHLVLAHPDRYSGPPVDLHEATSQVWVERPRIRELIRSGEIPGALSVVALLYALSFDRI